jgi:hypothetical protein
MRLFIIISIFITGCVSQPAVKSDSVGHFIHAGPSNAESDTLSTKWKYGFKFTTNHQSVTEVRLSCLPIPGTSVIVKKQNLNVNSNGIAFWDGDVLEISREETPWLFDSTTTVAICQAVVYRTGESNFVERAPVTFTGATKAATLRHMKEAHNYNIKLKRNN